MANSGTIEFYAELKFEGKGAYLLTDGAEELWIPKSQVIEMENKGGGNYRFEIPEWLAIDKGVI